MNLLTIATEWLKARWQESAIGMLCLLVVALYWPMENWLLFYASTLPVVWLLRTGLAMLLVTLISVTCAMYLHPRLRFLPEYGIYQDHKTGIFYCLSCQSKKLRSPLKEQANGWSCMVKECRMFYRNPSVPAEATQNELILSQRIGELEKEMGALRKP